MNSKLKLAGAGLIVLLLWSQSLLAEDRHHAQGRTIPRCIRVKIPAKYSQQPSKRVLGRTAHPRSICRQQIAAAKETGSSMEIAAAPVTVPRAVSVQNITEPHKAAPKMAISSAGGEGVIHERREPLLNPYVVSAAAIGFVAWAIHRDLSGRSEKFNKPNGSTGRPAPEPAQMKGPRPHLSKEELAAEYQAWKKQKRLGAHLEEI